MKCYYYLSPTLEDTEAIARDLKASGLRDWFVHIVSQDEAGLSRRQLHSSNYLETLDVVRDGLIGGVLGFLAGLLLVVILSVYEPLGTPNWLVILGVMVLMTGFGTWVGGLTGVAEENRKLAAFREDIRAGRYLILVYAGKKEEEKVAGMMSRLHPEARLVGSDAQVFNPFSQPQLPASH